MSARSLAAGLLIGALGACGGTEREPAAEPVPVPEVAPPEPTAPEPPPSATDDGERCLPIVHGCGCAYQCALGRPGEDGRWHVTHDQQDSRVDVATLERRCFDARGVSFHEDDANRPNDARCLDVFYDQTPCGGECIPTTEFLDCALDDGRACGRVTNG